MFIEGTYVTGTIFSVRKTRNNKNVSVPHIHRSLEKKHIDYLEKMKKKNILKTLKRMTNLDFRKTRSLCRSKITKRRAMERQPILRITPLTYLHPRLISLSLVPFLSTKYQKKYVSFLSKIKPNQPHLHIGKHLHKSFLILHCRPI